MQQLLEDRLRLDARQAWIDNIHGLPPDLTLAEVRDYLWPTRTSSRPTCCEPRSRGSVSHKPKTTCFSPRVRMMTMHRAKGLSARIVSIPGLEDEVFPGDFRRPDPGLVLEAARLLYVSISRARAACIVSYAATRMRFGQFTRMTPARFANSLGGAFVYQEDGGLTAAEVQAIVQDCGHL
jgi:DNA helicase II / ATP-dependent DNA helicase PcrA